MLPQGKTAVMIQPVTVTNAGTLTGYVDCRGYDFAEILVIGTTSATNEVPTVLKLTEHDTATAVASQSAIVAATGGTATSSSVGFVIGTPSATTTVPYTASFQVDLKGRKRYLGVSFSPVTTHTVSAVAKLYRGDELPTGTTKGNVSNLVAL